MLITNGVESSEFCPQDGLLFLKNLNTISIYTVWRSETDRFRTRNGPFRLAKRTVLEREMDHITICLNIR